MVSRSASFNGISMLSTDLLSWKSGWRSITLLYSSHISPGAAQGSAKLQTLLWKGACNIFLLVGFPLFPSAICLVQDCCIAVMKMCRGSSIHLWLKDSQGINARSCLLSLLKYLYELPQDLQACHEGRVCNIHISPDIWATAAQGSRRQALPRPWNHKSQKCQRGLDHDSFPALCIHARFYQKRLRECWVLESLWSGCCDLITL